MTEVTGLRESDVSYIKRKERTMAKFNLFGLNIGRKGKSDDDIASLLGTSPELLNEFEHTYHVETVVRLQRKHT